MLRMNLEPDAREYLILIGLSIEEWILEHCEEVRTGGDAERDCGEQGMITVADLRRSLPALCQQGVHQVVGDLDRHFQEQQEDLRRAG